MEQIISGLGYPTHVTRCRGALGCGDLQGHLRQDEHSSRDRLRSPSAGMAGLSTDVAELKAISTKE